MSPLCRFRFPLESVLRVRVLREEEARLELARSLMRLERSRQALRDTERRFAGTLANLRGSVAGSLAAPDYQMHANYLEHLKGAIQGWKARIEQEEAEIERQKLRLQRLHQERRLLANLRDKKYAQFQREFARTLEKEGEAAVLQRWPREAGL
jgi:flagellar export protein FliJ